MSDGGRLSLRALARLMGVSERAIRKAIAAGVFSSGAVSRDAGGIPVVVNATLAVDEWEKSGRQLRGSPRPAPTPMLPPTAVPAAALDQAPAAVDPQAEIERMLARVRELRLQLPPDAVPAAKDEDTSPTLVKAQTEAALERGRKLRLENNLREGGLVEADKASREAFDFARTLRENVLNIPGRLAAELAAERDTGRVHRRLEDALREALESTASKFEAAHESTTVVEAVEGDRG